MSSYQPQRPFFSNFLAAFRAQAAFKSTTSITLPSSNPATPRQLSTSAQHLSPQTTSNPASSAQQPQSFSNTSNTQPSSSATAIPTKSPHPFASAAVAAFSPPSSNARHNQRRQSQSPPHFGSGFSSPRRRGSDTSSEGGWRETKTAEKWFVGGRTMNGEEKIYQLSMIKKQRSWERKSIDQMSL